MKIGVCATTRPLRGDRMTTTIAYLVAGIGDGETTACLMSYRALLDGRGLTDGHPSASVGALGIALNDSSLWLDDGHRTAVLMPLALDNRLCASRVETSPRLEAARAYRCARWAQQWTDDERVDECLGVVEAWLAGDESADLEEAAAAAANTSSMAMLSVRTSGNMASESARAALSLVAGDEKVATLVAGSVAAYVVWLVHEDIRNDPSQRDRVIAEACALLLALCEMTE